MSVAASAAAKRAETEKLKDKARALNEAQNSKNFTWVDRIACEMKAQREWSEKWSSLVDPKLYLGEAAGEKFHTKAQPTKWSAYSILNTPQRNPLSSRPSSAESSEEQERYFKITGTRNDYLTYKNARHPSYPFPKGPPSTQFNSTSRYMQDFGGSVEFNHKTGIYERKSLRSHDRNEEKMVAAGPTTNTTRKLNHGSLASFNPPTAQKRQPQISPEETSFLTTASALSSAKQASDNSARFASHRKSKEKTPPGEIYSYPATTNMEYGWTYNGRKSLELFGNTSADYAKERWKRHMATH